MPAVGITDHGSMAGAIELYRTAGKAGIKPLLGCEIYLVDDRRSRTHSNQRDWNHLTLLAETTAGYHNLIKLCTLGYLEGYYYKPRVDYELLETYADGHHRALGLPLRSHLLGAAAGRRRPRARGARPPGADLRARRRLRRAAGRGHRRAQDRQPGPPRARGRRRPAGGRHGRRALPARRGCRAARGAALHPDQRPALEPEPLPLLDAGLLPQVARRDEPDDGALGRRRPARADARDRRALQRRARPRAHPPAALRRGRRRLVRNAAAPVRGGHARALRRRSISACATGSSSSSRRSARWASPTTS